MDTLAKRLLARRTELGLKQSDLAEVAGVSTAAVSQWERGETKNLKLEHLFSIADALKVQARWLALGEGKGPRIMKAATILLAVGALHLSSPSPAVAADFVAPQEPLSIMLNRLRILLLKFVRFLTVKSHGLDNGLIPT